MMVRFPSASKPSTRPRICSLSGPIITLPPSVTTTAPGAISLWLISIIMRRSSVRRLRASPPLRQNRVNILSFLLVALTYIYNPERTPFPAAHIYLSGTEVGAMVPKLNGMESRR